MKTYKRGISLIVLVITVIVLAILATTIIITISNTNIINKAKESIDKYNTNSIKELIQYYRGEYLLEKDEGMTEAEYLQEKFNNSGYPDIADEIEIRANIKTGDYINYIPTTGVYSVVGGDLGTGYKDVQNFTTDSNLTWRVYSINDDYSIDIVPAWYTSNVVYLDGAAAANNGVEILNDLCENLYSNTSLGVVARNITLEDINKKAKYTSLKYGTTPISEASKPEYEYPTVWQLDYGKYNSSIEYSKASVDENGIYSYTIGSSPTIKKSELDQSLLYYWSLDLDNVNRFYLSSYLIENLGNNSLPYDFFNYKPLNYAITIDEVERYFIIIDKGLSIHDIRREPDLCMDIDYSELPQSTGEKVINQRCIEVVNVNKSVEDKELAELLDSYKYTNLLTDDSGWIATKMYSIDPTGTGGTSYLENIHLYVLRYDCKVQGYYMYQSNGTTYFSASGEYYKGSVMPVVNIPLQLNLQDTGDSDYVRKGYSVYDILK